MKDADALSLGTQIGKATGRLAALAVLGRGPGGAAAAFPGREQSVTCADLDSAVSSADWGERDFWSLAGSSISGGFAELKGEHECRLMTMTNQSQPCGTHLLPPPQQTPSHGEPKGGSAREWFGSFSDAEEKSCGASSGLVRMHP